LIGQIGLPPNRVVDTRGQGIYIGFASADDNAKVRHRPAVQSDEMTTVEGHHGTLRREGVRQNLVVCNASITVSCLLGSENIVAKLPESLHNGKAKVFVRVKISHFSRGFVLPNRLFDFIGVLSIIFPGNIEVLLR
jgi:hypothetical protein